MARREHLNRNCSYRWQPVTDFDQYDMSDSSPIDRGRVRKLSSPYPRSRPDRHGERGGREREQERELGRGRGRGRRPTRDESTETHEEKEPNYSSSDLPIPNTMKIMKSLNSISIELDYLASVGIVSEEQRSDILRELPDNIPVLYDLKKKKRRRRNRRDTCCRAFQGECEEEKPKKKKDTVEWAINVAKKFGNSAMFGLGCTFAGDMMKLAMKAL